MDTYAGDGAVRLKSLSSVAVRRLLFGPLFVPIHDTWPVVLLPRLLLPRGRLRHLIQLC